MWIHHDMNEERITALLKAMQEDKGFYDCVVDLFEAYFEAPLDTEE